MGAMLLPAAPVPPMRGAKPGRTISRPSLSSPICSTELESNRLLTALSLQ